MKALIDLSRMLLLFLTITVATSSANRHNAERLLDDNSNKASILQKLNDITADIASIRTLLNEIDEVKPASCDCSSTPSPSPTSSLSWATEAPSQLITEEEIQIPTIRIMPLGDALTKGQNAFPGGYRKRLYWRLKSLGYNVDFVGSKKTNGSPGVDRDHEGNGGSTIAYHQRFAQFFLDRIEYPDVILLHVGSSDFGRNIDIENAIHRYDALIQQIGSLRPSAHIIATTLIVRKDSTKNEAVNTLFNPFVEDVVKKNAANGINVSFLDMNTVVRRGQLVDGIHPNQEGYDAMGLAWAGAIQEVIAPNGDIYPPPTQSPTVTRSPTVTPSLPAIRIMPLGSNLTVGQPDYPGGYRKRVYNVLTSQGWNIDFVGSKKTNKALGVDRNHEGIANRRIQYFERVAESLLDNIDDPDIILLHVGMIDFMRNHDVENAINRYDSLIKKLAELRPSSHIIATNLLDMGNEAVREKVNLYFNPFVEAVVEKNADNGVLVSYLDIRDYVNADSVLEGTLLNQQGYNGMADGWISAIKELYTREGPKN